MLFCCRCAKRAQPKNLSALARGTAQAEGSENPCSLDAGLSLLNPVSHGTPLSGGT